MVVLPKEFVATKYPGYFWNIETKQLYSCKVDGVLSPLTFCKGGFFFGHLVPPGYRVSVKGRRRNLTLENLMKLKPTDQTFPVKDSK